jgi:hypothetical protein
MTSRSLLTVAVVLLLASPAGAQTVVSTCGQEVHGFAALNADLDCTGFPNHAVTIHGGKLNLNGHTLTGGVVSVFCDGNCQVIGPGMVTGSTGIGIIAFGVPFKMTQVDVTNHPIMGVECFKACKLLGPGTISGNGTGVRAGTMARLRSVSVSGNNTGIDAVNDGLRGRALIHESTISGNRIGVTADVLVKSLNSTITGNAQYGISVGNESCTRKGLATLKAGTATGNGTDPDCGTTIACADVATCGTAPHLAGMATCDHSYVRASGIPGSDWNVCALD